MRLILLSGFFFALLLSPGVRAKSKPVVHTVIIEGMKFNPDQLTVNSGDIIVWNNKDIVPHTATGDHHEFDSKEIKSGSSWKYTTKKKGNFSYSCTFHPTMKAQLQVQ